MNARMERSSPLSFHSCSRLQIGEHFVSGVALGGPLKHLFLDACCSF
jgi:hypothetical protein